MKSITPQDYPTQDGPCPCKACANGFPDHCVAQQTTFGNLLHCAVNGPDGEPLVVLEPTQDGEIQVTITTGESGFIMRDERDVSLFAAAAGLVLASINQNKKPKNK